MTNEKSVVIGNQPAGLKEDGEIFAKREDLTGFPVENYLYKEQNAFTVLDPVPQYSRTLNLAPGHGFTNPNRADFIEDFLVIHYDDGTDFPRYFQTRVTSVTDDTITVGIDIPFAISNPSFITYAYRVDTNMAVDGSTIKQVFSTFPPDNLIWRINRILITFIVNSKPTDGLFGAGDPLTNGIFFGVKSDTTSEYQVNIIDNGELADSAYDLTYAERQTPATDWGIRVRKTINGAEKSGISLELLARTNDAFELHIQDNLTLAARGIKRLKVKVNGYIYRPRG